MLPETTSSISDWSSGNAISGWATGRSLRSVQRLLAALFDRFLQDFQHQATPEHLLEMNLRHLALAKAAQLNIVLDVIKTLFASRVEVGHRQDDLNFALQPIGTRFSYLH